MAKTMLMVSLCNDEGHISVNTHLRFIFLGKFHDTLCIHFSYHNFV